MFDFPRGKATPAMIEIAEQVIPRLRTAFGKPDRGPR
jgi:hypothetical protein